MAKTALATPDPDRGFEVTDEVRELVDWAVNTARDPNTHPAVQTNLNLAFGFLRDLANPAINRDYRDRLSWAVLDAAKTGDLWTSAFNAFTGRREVA